MDMHKRLRRLDALLDALAEEAKGLTDEAEHEPTRRKGIGLRVQVNDLRRLVNNLAAEREEV